jgi:DNA-binding response OmpR family regulator
MMSARNILIVDDDHDLHASLKQFLEGEGFQVRSAFDGDEARILLRGRHRRGEAAPDYILLDLMMPRLSGQDFLRGLEAEDLGEARLVVLSASEPKELPGKFPLTFLPKPFELDNLLEVLK